MTKIDYLVLTRLASRIAVTALIVFAIIFLVESLAGWRSQHLTRLGGPLLGAAGAAVAAAIWSIRFLPITVLIGAVVGLLELRMRMELPVINAAGISIWRILRAPLLGIMALGVVLGFVGDGVLVSLTRAMSANLPAANSGDELWLKQSGDGVDYVMVSRRPHPGGAVLEDVTIFLPVELGGPRIEATRAELRNGAWEIADGTRYSAEQPAQRLTAFRVSRRSPSMRSSSPACWRTMTR